MTKVKYLVWYDKVDHIWNTELNALTQQHSIGEKNDNKQSKIQN